MPYDRKALSAKLAAAEKMLNDLTDWVREAKRNPDGLWQVWFQDAMYPMLDLVDRLERAVAKMPRRTARG